MATVLAKQVGYGTSYVGAPAAMHHCDIINNATFRVRVRFFNANFWENGASLLPGQRVTIQVPGGDVAICAFNQDSGAGLFASMLHVTGSFSVPLP